MLGHKKFSPTQENVFRLIFETVSPQEKVSELLCLHCSRYPVITFLYRHLDGSDFFRFLGIFGDIRVTVPAESDPEESFRVSLLPEMIKDFGEEFATSVVMEYGGGNVKIPPTNQVISSIRDVDIFFTLSCAKSDQIRKELVGRLARHYSVRPAEVHWSFRRTRDSLKGIKF